jgi:hypothetical protein
VNLGRPPWSNPEVRTPLDNDRRRGRSARRDRGGAGPAAENRREATAAARADERPVAARNRREARSERDRAYMGGGMLDTRGSDGTGAATATPSTGTGVTGSGNQPGIGGTSQAR